MKLQSFPFRAWNLIQYWVKFIPMLMLMLKLREKNIVLHLHMMKWKSLEISFYLHSHQIFCFVLFVSFKFRLDVTFAWWYVVCLSLWNDCCRFVYAMVRQVEMMEEINNNEQHLFFTFRFFFGRRLKQIAQQFSLQAKIKKRFVYVYFWRKR